MVPGGVKNDTDGLHDVNDEAVDSVLNYLPLVAIVIAAIGFQIGLSPITWSYMGEIIQRTRLGQLWSLDSTTYM